MTSRLLVLPFASRAPRKHPRTGYYQPTIPASISLPDVAGLDRTRAGSTSLQKEPHSAAAGRQSQARPRHRLDPGFLGPLADVDDVSSHHIVFDAQDTQAIDSSSFLQHSKG